MELPIRKLMPEYHLLLILVGLMMVTNEFERLSSYLQGFTPEFLKRRL